MNKKESSRKIFNWPLIGLFLFIFIALLGSASIIAYGFLSLDPKNKSIATQPEDNSEREEAFFWKDGEIPLPVIIDNMKDAWPQEGLEKARVVFEAPVESGITRFLAIFGSKTEVDSIGPVRSARPYSVDWAEEFGTILAHVGGSDAALTQLQSSELYNLDEYRYGGVYFERRRDRFAPYNAFTSLKLLNKFFDKVSSGKDLKWNKWGTKEDDVNLGNMAYVSIAYNKFYNVRWEYRQSTNDYIRLVNDKVFKTIDNAIRAKNIVVLKTDIIIIDSISRRKIRTDGDGEALIFQDGKAILGKWKKENNFTKFYNQEGAEVLFNKGQVWVEVVSDVMKIDYSSAEDEIHR